MAGDPTFIAADWNTREINALSSRVTGLAYGESTWTLVQENGPILWSDDTVAWHRGHGAPASEVAYESVAFTDGLFMAVTRTGEVYTSSDGAHT